MSRLALLLVSASMLAGCQSAYCAAAEKVGYAKRDILVNRVESARDAQVDARGEITDALTEFRKVVDFEGGELEARYESLAAQLEDSEDAANEVHRRVRDVEDVAEVRAKSEQRLRKTRARYDQMIGAMQRAEGRLEPALRPLRDQVLYLKHNLNAQAIAGIKGEVVQVDALVSQLVAEIDRATAEADRSIAGLEQGGA